MLKENSTILFQGDSITDAGRTYDLSGECRFKDLKDEHLENLKFGLGAGYPLQVKQYIDTFYSNKNITVLNRGISGDKSINLVNRWDRDCLDLKPDILSILVGVNDTWRRYDSNDPTTAIEYEKNLRFLVSSAKEKLNCKIVIIEPFLIPFVDIKKDEWRIDLDPKIHIARKIAKEFETEFIPMDGIFAKEVIKTNPCDLSADGVHPTILGHTIIAKEWIKTMLG